MYLDSNHAMRGKELNPDEVIAWMKNARQKAFSHQRRAGIWSCEPQCSQADICQGMRSA